MKNALIFILIFTFPLFSFGAREPSPKVKQIQLKRYTTFTAYIVPDLGVRFSFPFILDQTLDEVPFTLSLSSPAFEHDWEEGRDSFIILSPANKQGGAIPKYHGNLFVTVGGYHITVHLTTTGDLRRHVTDYKFIMSKKDKEKTIQYIVKRRLKSMKEEYERKEAMLDVLAQEVAYELIGKLALSGPKTTGIKEEVSTIFDDGDKVTLYLDKLQTYGPFHLFIYEIDNDSATKSLKIQSAKLDYRSKNNTLSLDSSNNIVPNIGPGKKERGVVVTQYAKLMEGGNITLSLITDRGKIVVTW